MVGSVNFSSVPVAVDQGKYTKEYFEDYESKAQSLAELKEDREKSPGWNTVKTVAVSSLAAVSQLGQLVGSMFGHTVFALPSALVGGIFGFCVYAPFMKAVDHLSGRENTKSFLEYTITPANILSNFIYNRVTDLACRYVVGFGLMVAVVEPVYIILGGLAAGTLLSPLIYNDFKNNNSKNVEHFIDGPGNFSVKLSTQHYLWQKFDDWAAGIKRTPLTLHDRIAAQVNARQVSIKDLADLVG
ncbi:hypothetical protein J7438_00900 [Thalassotalea sp. G20_0]|uniref:hypothetical protein n=1 Tax=Thalassotalea sp. G20_0 TaxID=2821093 RepID=UPI001ADCE3B9|nr:hypothetical protein [Thalassotalea sp. G20_0]MBO9492655.1 hypothetical protein [Thalassotalea sp. G20_0]